jgi:chromate transporter
MIEPQGVSFQGSRSAAQRTSLRELAVLFLKLGTVAFGGPAAHIAIMDDEIVRRRGGCRKRSSWIC